MNTVLHPRVILAVLLLGCTDPITDTGEIPGKTQTIRTLTIRTLTIRTLTISDYRWTLFTAADDVAHEEIP